MFLFFGMHHWLDMHYTTKQSAHSRLMINESSVESNLPQASGEFFSSEKAVKYLRVPTNYCTRVTHVIM